MTELLKIEDLHISVEGNEIIKGLNNATISVPLEKMSKAKKRVLIAGGTEKVRGLYSLLVQNNAPLEISDLVIDEIAARDLCRMITGKKRVGVDR